MFASASVEVAERGPYRYAYLNAQGYYSKLAARQQQTILHLPTLEIYDASVLSVGMPLHESASSSAQP
jgi:hypothetical protein